MMIGNVEVKSAVVAFSDWFAEKYECAHDEYETEEEGFFDKVKDEFFAWCEEHGVEGEFDA